jgi:hypothetical protein
MKVTVLANGAGLKSEESAVTVGVRMAPVTVNAVEPLTVPDVAVIVPVP